MGKNPIWSLHVHPSYRPLFIDEMNWFMYPTQNVSTTSLMFILNKNLKA
jgi:hypothetical protein